MVRVNKGEGDLKPIERPKVKVQGPKPKKETVELFWELKGSEIDVASANMLFAFMSLHRHRWLSISNIRRVFFGVMKDLQTEITQMIDQTVR